MENKPLLISFISKFPYGSSLLMPINGMCHGNSKRTCSSILLNRGNYVYIWATRGDIRLKKAARAGVISTHTNLTQPTGLGGGRAEDIITAIHFAPWWDSIGAFCFCRERQTLLFKGDQND